MTKLRGNPRAVLVAVSLGFCIAVASDVAKPGPHRTAGRVPVPASPAHDGEEKV
ncbi:MAG TPA: hypothetical protein VFQ68_22830 [Streptosporangiaceae bacterium]|nr:hypothetical protein [Streptosporangiaceae bacterium]